MKQGGFGRLLDFEAASRLARAATIRHRGRVRIVSGWTRIHPRRPEPPMARSGAGGGPAFGNAPNSGGKVERVDRRSVRSSAVHYRDIAWEPEP
jgi:hypothetical protein